jgi:FkbM family methyltransferase
LYRRGWRGINVDPLPGSARLFRRQRPRDISLECGVASHAGVLTYHAFNDPALNTFSPEEAARKNAAPYRLLGTSQVPVHTLAEILDRYLPPSQLIDFLSIDAEGLDHDIVASNDWEKYRPRWVLVELLQTNFAGVDVHPTAQLLQQAGYAPCAKTLNTVFFQDQRTAA